jgi:hypothetical protein
MGRISRKWSCALAHAHMLKFELDFKKNKKNGLKKNGSSALLSGFVKPVATSALVMSV